MANFNKVILAGNLTRDPQLTFLPNNTPVCELGMAINRKWRGQNGDMREETCFVDIRCYGKQAETLNQYMSKGRPLLVEGRLKYDQWEGKDGGKRSKLYVIVDQFQFLGSPSGGGRGDSRTVDADQAPAASASRGRDEMPPHDQSGGPDDVPF